VLGELEGAFDGTRSLANAVILTMQTATLQIAKKSQPASAKKESLIMMQDPQRREAAAKGNLATS
jgi:hypothetical protein